MQLTARDAKAAFRHVTHHRRRSLGFGRERDGRAPAPLSRRVRSIVPLDGLNLHGHIMPKAAEVASCDKIDAEMQRVGGPGEMHQVDHIPAALPARNRRQTH